MRSARTALWGIFLLALLGRVVAFLLRPPLHPDEIFQYLEPAQWHLHGFGTQAWEWQVGLRSWVYPGYHGAWMSLLGCFGVERGLTLLRFFQLHWAILSAAGVFFAWYAGRAMARIAGRKEQSELAGLVAAGLYAVNPVLCWFSPHTLIEGPAMLCTTMGYTLWLELVTEDDPRRCKRLAIYMGLLLGLGASLRLANAPLAVVPFVDPALWKRTRAALAGMAAGLVPALAFGFVDLVTLGGWFHSARAYLDYNFFKGRASDHGVSGTWQYATWIASRGGLLLVAGAPALLFNLRSVWRFLLPAVVLVGYLSTQAHKEERFILQFWPLVVIAIGASVVLLAAALPSIRARRLLATVALVAAVAACGSSAWSISNRERTDYDGRDPLFRAQDFVGRQADVTGVIYEGRFHLNGGYFVLGKNVPHQSFNVGLLRAPIYNYAILENSGGARKLAEASGFYVFKTIEGFVVMKRHQRAD